ncbi:chitobiosyldiphosphodolichol beta-mannosyltransferase [Pectinophora gossypiella]|uniref:chitobiosyldiphosphodolichol beta-mannosyltransferase n=1 Tax=Pectinophora gossypiella TaxID=13191 RepID=UPI00214EAFE0|nr:chitobiosyldiphosphodolichol beta-mannosyltransferase [Pectinophora gossypiella]
MERIRRQKTVKIVVLGDIGRSPRMQYHALSLASHGFKVNFIGYEETFPPDNITRNSNIEINKLKPFEFDKGPKVFQYALKVIWQTITLMSMLYKTGKCEYLLCQNPPAIPTLPVCRLFCFLTRTKFIIDWHNYAYTIMGLTLSPKNPILLLAKYIEKVFGRTSDHNFCVTYAMKEDLSKNWNITAKVLYDRAPREFRPISLDEKHKWFVKISQQYFVFGCKGRDQLNLPTSEITRTTFTHKLQGLIHERADRPGLIFSSTSWSRDEDFGILMDALQVYETTYNLANNLPKLVCIITGRGPMKQHYIDEIGDRKWQHVRVVTPWLESADYPTMVACADLGICLHTSSSGLDLPMKVVDMFGAGLPVFAYEYKTLGELVQNDVNGFTFKNSDELAKMLVTWFEDFPYNDAQNQIVVRIREELVNFRRLRWEENWDRRIKPFFES